MRQEKHSIWFNRVALVTGGSSGIGLEAGKQLAAQGAHVFLAARRVELLDGALKALEAARVSPSQCFGIYSVDVSDAAQAAGVVEAVTARAGLPDLVINSAGVVHPGYIQDLDLERYRWMMEINYFGVVNIVKAVLPGMMERRSGQIVNISSAASFLGITGYSAYAPSKVAVNGFSEALRAECKPYGIQVSLAFPPDTDTPQLAYENQYKPLETQAISGTFAPLPAERVARKILEGAAAGKFWIYPNLEVRLMHYGVRFLGGVLHSFVDWFSGRARRGKDNL